MIFIFTSNTCWYIFAQEHTFSKEDDHLASKLAKIQKGTFKLFKNAKSTVCLLKKCFATHQDPFNPVEKISA